MPINTAHREYVKYLPIWQRNHDAAEGEWAVKFRKSRYLPVPNGNGGETESGERYKAYITRALYVNYVGRTLQGLLGMATRQEPSVELPPQIDYLLTDADNNRLALDTLSARVVSNLLLKGRYILTPDYTGRSNEGETPTLEQTAQSRAFIKGYIAESLINWHVDANGQLDLAVLKETVEENIDGFQFELVDYFREYRLIDGKAYVREWRQEIPISEYMPIKMNGTIIDELPVIIAGSLDNNTTCDMPPITDIANVNIGHYRNSADYEEGVFICGQPTPVINVGTMSAHDWVLANPNGVQLGSSRGLVVEQGGGAILLQAAANGAAIEAMRAKEDQMIQLGAQIITPKTGSETVQAAKMRAGAETSTLQTVVKNTSSAIEQCLKWCASFVGANAELVRFEMTNKFFDESVDPQMLIVAMQLQDRADIAKSDVRHIIRRSGLLREGRTDEEIDAEAEVETSIIFNQPIAQVGGQA